MYISAASCSAANACGVIRLTSSDLCCITSRTTLEKIKVHLRLIWKRSKQIVEKFTAQMLHSATIDQFWSEDYEFLGAKPFYFGCVLVWDSFSVFFPFLW